MIHTPPLSSHPSTSTTLISTPTMHSPSDIQNLNLQKIRDSKNTYNQILEITHPGHVEAENTIALSWAAIQDFLLQNNHINIRQLNSLVSIIYKLTSSYNLLRSIELKSKEFTLKENKQSDSLKLVPSSKSPHILEPETLEKFEHNLNLL